VHVFLFPMQHPSHDGFFRAKLGSGGDSKSRGVAVQAAFEKQRV
jgi:hypothetical protein